MGLTVEQKLADQISKYWADPLGYVMFAFPWTTEPTIQMVPLAEKYRKRFPGCEWGPDQWACEFLDDLGKEIRKRGFKGKESVPPIRFSTASGHGIGKSTLVAWLIKFILDTRPLAKGIVTANTSDQLRTKTWAELGKWNAMSVTAHLWHYSNSRNSMAIYRAGEKHISDNWRADAQTCREENSEAFQGLHAASSTPFYIFDEASGIPDKIWEARFGGGTDGEPMSFDFGNPTRKSGYFYENCIGQYRHRYNVRSIDSRDVYLTNKALFEEWRHDWGEDSDLFKVKVRGIFPSAGSVQFIGTDLVTEATNRRFEVDKYEPLVIGVDVARQGDDFTVIYPRIGYDASSFPFKKFNGLDTVQVVDKIIETLQEFKQLGKECAGLFIDLGNSGAGVVDVLGRLGYNPIGINFGNKASTITYRYKGDEMWGKLKDALPLMSLPKDTDLVRQLTQREFGYTLGTERIHLEPKKIMKERLGNQLGASPDIADALALTFAQEPSRELAGYFPAINGGMVQHEYDPLEGARDGSF